MVVAVRQVLSSPACKKNNNNNNNNKQARLPIAQWQKRPRGPFGFLILPFLEPAFTGAKKAQNFFALRAKFIKRFETVANL